MENKTICSCCGHPYPARKNQKYCDFCRWLLGRLTRTNRDLAIKCIPKIWNKEDIKINGYIFRTRFDNQEKYDQYASFINDFKSFIFWLDDYWGKDIKMRPCLQCRKPIYPISSPKQKYHLTCRSEKRIQELREKRKINKKYRNEAVGNAFKVQGKLMNQYHTGKGTFKFSEHRKESFDDERNEVDKLLKKFKLRK